MALKASADIFRKVVAMSPMPAGRQPRRRPASQTPAAAKEKILDS
jgi:hypothetical protein